MYLVRANKINGRRRVRYPGERLCGQLQYEARRRPGWLLLRLGEDSPDTRTMVYVFEGNAMALPWPITWPWAFICHGDAIKGP